MSLDRVDTVMTTNRGALPSMVARSGAAKLGDVVSVRDFGAVGDGSTDDTAAVQAAVASILANRAESSLFFPAGVYRLSSRLVFAMAANRVLEIVGDGKASTELRWTAANGGISVTYQGESWWFRGDGPYTANSVTVSDLALSTTVASGSSGTALFVDGACWVGRPSMEPTVRDVMVRGADGISAWDVGIDLLNCADSRVSDVHVCFENQALVGTGLRFRSSAPVALPGGGERRFDPTAHMVYGYRQYFGSVGITAGDYVEGIHATNCVIVGTDYGVHWSTATGESQLALRGSHINAATADIYMKNVHDSAIVGNFLTKPAGSSAPWYGILLDGCGNTAIAGNTISAHGANAENGIVLDNSITGSNWFDDKPSVYSGNVIRHINGTAIWLKNNTGNTHVADNNYSSVGRRYLNDGLRIGNTRNTNRGRRDGAMVSRRGSNQSIPSGALTAVIFDTRDDDTGELDGGGGGAIAKLGSLPTRLTVMTGHSRVELAAQVALSNSPTLRQINIILMKNGSINFPGNGNQSIATDNGTQQNIGWTLNVRSGVIDVVPGDYFEIGVYALNDGTAINILASGVGHTTWFQMECIE